MEDIIYMLHLLLTTYWQFIADEEGEKSFFFEGLAISRFPML